MDFRAQTNLPRGIRNNNPGNIRAGDSWQGMVGQDDAGFIIFSDDTWGLRALATDLQTKINKDNLTTISDIISVYAPPSENNTAAYIAAVSADTGIGADDELTADAQTLFDLVRAIANHENGDSYSAMIPDADITQGISMMGNSPGTLLQAATIAVSNNTDNSAWILGAVVLAIGGLIYYKYRRR